MSRNDLVSILFLTVETALSRNEIGGRKRKNRVFAAGASCPFRTFPSHARPGIHSHSPYKQTGACYAG